MKTDMHNNALFKYSAVNTQFDCKLSNENTRCASYVQCLTVLDRNKQKSEDAMHTFLHLFVQESIVVFHTCVKL
jgi:hypothetical protein